MKVLKGEMTAAKAAPEKAEFIFNESIRDVRFSLDYQVV